MQLIYQGITKWCHPKFLFPEGFNVIHTSSHWYIEEKAKKILLDVINPRVQKTEVKKN